MTRKRMPAGQTDENVDEQIRQNLHRREVARLRSAIQCIAERALELTQRVLVESGNNYLGEVREQMIESKTRAWERRHPVIDDEQANNELHQELHEITDPNRLCAQADRHGRDVPVGDHADKLYKADEGQERHANRRKRVTVLCCKVGQVVGELIQPIDAGTGLQKKCKGGHRMEDHDVGTPLSGSAEFCIYCCGVAAAFCASRSRIF